ncbi:MAG TPA: F0F1 ATP synthase subunit B [Methylophaga sp.]|nr:F0F1 ATP synthase subunit B [Methylophaga sp.]
MYQPILNVIDAREKRITDQIDLAKKTQSTAMEHRLEFEGKNKNFEQKHEALLDKANKEAQALHQQLVVDARSEVDNLRTQWQESLRKEQLNLSEGIAKRVRQEVLDISRKSLTELADCKLEEQMVTMFIKRLKSLDDVEKMQLSAQSKDAVSAIIIRSAFELAEAERTSLTEVVQTTLSTDNAVQFEIEPELISGIQLIGSGHKIAWNTADYLSSLEASISSLLDKKPAEEKGAEDA